MLPGRKAEGWSPRAQLYREQVDCADRGGRMGFLGHVFPQPPLSCSHYYGNPSVESSARARSTGQEMLKSLPEVTGVADFRRTNEGTSPR